MLFLEEGICFWQKLCFFLNCVHPVPYGIDDKIIGLSRMVWEVKKSQEFYWHKLTVSIRIFSAIGFSHHSSYLTFFTLFDITSSFFSLFSSLFLPVPTLVHQQPSNPISKFSGPGQTNSAFPLTKLLAEGVAF